MEKLTQRITVLVVDDHPVFRMGLMSMLKSQHQLSVVGSASSGSEAIKLVGLHRPDVVLMDLRMPEMSGNDTIKLLRGSYPTCRILVLTNYETDEDIYSAMRNGALGYLVKDASLEEIVHAINSVSKGKKHMPQHIAERLATHMLRSPLTPRESDILQMIAKGWTNKRIGDELGISENTVRNHVNHILEKLEVVDRTEAATTAIQRGMIRHFKL
jgi:two-component system, NarL family, response regulator